MLEKGTLSVGPHEFSVLPRLTEDVIVVQLKNLPILKKNDFISGLLGQKLVILATRHDVDVKCFKESDYVAIATDLGGQPYSVRVGFLNLVQSGKFVADSSSQVVNLIQQRLNSVKIDMAKVA